MGKIGQNKYCCITCRKRDNGQEKDCHMVHGYNCCNGTGALTKQQLKDNDGVDPYGR